MVEFEERAASLYLTLARRFVNNKALSWFWLELSMEEKQHALLLEFCGCEHMIAKGLPGRREVQKLMALFSSLEQRVARKDLSVDDAFLIAVDLEASEINDAYEGAIKPIQGTWYITRKKIGTLTSDHMQTLVRAARKFGVSAPVLARLVQMKRQKTAKAG